MFSEIDKPPKVCDCHKWNGHAIKEDAHKPHLRFFLFTVFNFSGFNQLLIYHLLPRPNQKEQFSQKCEEQSPKVKEEYTGSHINIDIGANHREENNGHHQSEELHHAEGPAFKWYGSSFNVVHVLYISRTGKTKLL